ncbi:MAG: DUF3149 domain-containing protein [Betaproteobacteria bacterium]|nr:DUF3149 domain-containing protein [Betaproteobacteria bacterium]
MAWQELFGTDVGLLSLAVIVFMLGIGVFFVRLFVRKMNSEVPAAPAARRTPTPPPSLARTGAARRSSPRAGRGFTAPRRPAAGCSSRR